MLANLKGYWEPIISACIMFPFIAGLFTVPFMARQYRRFGGIAFMRVLVVYSFILYSMCAFLLTVLPLPSFEEVIAMPDRVPRLIPFKDFYDGLKNAGLQLAKPSTLLSLGAWKKFLTSRDLFQIIANIVMQVPLGIYLRYYFRRNWKQTLIIGFCVSLFYELTQLSGLYFLYPKAYRFFEVDDLINNTLGAMIGFWVTPLLAKLLPKREDIDRISYDKGHRITVIRRIFAAGVDWLVFFFIWGLIPFLPLGEYTLNAFVMYGFFGYIAWVLLYFVLAQWLFKGRTLGKSLIRIRLVADSDGASPPSLKQHAIRYCMIYFLTMPLFMIEFMLLVAMSLMSSMSDELRAALIVACFVLIALTLLVLLRSFKKWNTFPHGHYSRTTITTTAPRKPLKTATPELPLDDKTPCRTDSQP